MNDKLRTVRKDVHKKVEVFKWWAQRARRPKKEIWGKKLN